MIEATQDLSQDFRLAMRRMASSVHLILSSDHRGRAGMTATAVSSLSFDPLSLLVCINRSATLFETLTFSNRFSINILSEQDVAIANMFGRSSGREERFAKGNWSTIGEVPILKTAVSSIVCELINYMDHGTHRVVIGQVEAVRFNNLARPLLYVDGAFALAEPIHF